MEIRTSVSWSWLVLQTGYCPKATRRIPTGHEKPLRSHCRDKDTKQRFCCCIAELRGSSRLFPPADRTHGDGDDDGSVSSLGSRRSEADVSKCDSISAVFVPVTQLTSSAPSSNRFSFQPNTFDPRFIINLTDLVGRLNLSA